MAKEKKIQKETNQKQTVSGKSKQANKKIEKTEKVETALKKNAEKIETKVPESKKNKRTTEKKSTNSTNKKKTASKSESLKKEEIVQAKTKKNKIEKSKNENKKENSKIISNKKEVVLEDKPKKEKTKDTKTKNEKIKMSSIVSSDEMGKLIRIVLVLILIVVAFYGITVLVIKFQKTSVPDRNKNTTPAVIQYDEILIGTMLDQLRDEYYVLIQKDDDQYQILTSYYLSTYNSKKNALKVYSSNMNSVFNQFYVAEKSNIKPSNINDFRVSEVTLVKIKNHQIIEAYEGIEAVETALKKLVK